MLGQHLGGLRNHPPRHGQQRAGMPADRGRTIACATRATAASPRRAGRSCPCGAPISAASRSPRAPAPGCPPTAARRGREASRADSASPSRSARRCTACRERRRNTGGPSLATPGHRRACRSVAPPRSATRPRTGIPRHPKAAGTVALVAFEHRLPAGDVDPPLRLGVDGAVAQPADRFDALGLRVHAHQRVGHLDRGAAYRCHLGARRQHQLAYAGSVGLTLRRLHDCPDDGTGGLDLAAANLLCHIGIGGQRFVHRGLDQ